MSILKYRLLPLAALVLPFAAFAQTLTDILTTISGLLNTVIPILFIIATIVFLWGVIAYIISGTEEGKKKAKSYILYGIIGLAVMVALWGLANVLVNTFLPSVSREIPTTVGGAGGGAPLPPATQ